LANSFPPRHKAIFKNSDPSYLNFRTNFQA
jgi:hypothetical protein